jgi:putative sigma-54 modulation protein
MRIAYTFRNLEPSESMKSYAGDKLAKLQKYVRTPLEVEVTFAVERHVRSVDVTLTSDGENYLGREENEDMYASIDLVIDKLKKQVVRTKGVHTARRRGEGREAVGE